MRRFRRHPGASVVPMLTLAVGIGANVALFSVLRGVLLRPLPYPQPERLVRLWETNPELFDEPQDLSPLNFVDWERADTGLESMAAWYLSSLTVRGEFGAEEIRSAQVTADFFRVLGVDPAMGRGLTSDDLPGRREVVLGDRLWQRLFGRDPNVLGRTLVSADVPYEIVGVLPPQFAFPDESVEIWVAWDLRAAYRDRPEARSWRFMGGIGRLEPDVAIERAEDRLDALAATLAEAHPAENRGWRLALTPLRDDVIGDVRRSLWLSFGAVVCILLIACANVANLVLGRAPARRREIAIRAAIGATRRRLILGLLAENLVLALVAGLAGLAFGSLLLDGLVAVDAGNIPRLNEVRLDAPVLLFAVGTSVLTSLIFGLAPALQLIEGAGASTLRQGARGLGSRGQTRGRELFVISQVAIALVLLTGAGLFRGSLTRLAARDPGFDPDGVAAFRVSLDPTDGDADAIVGYYEALLEDLRSIPGVASVGAAQALPLSPVGTDFRRPYRRAGSGIASADAPAAQMRIVTPEYPATMGMRLLEGEVLPGSARPGDPLVALVNETLARRLWPAGRPVGEIFEIDFRNGWQPYRVVGVVQDVNHYGPRADVLPEAYLSHAQVPYLAMSVVVRTTVAPEMMFSPLRDAVLARVPMQPPYDFVTLTDLSRAAVAEERFLSWLLGIAAGIALMLATTGVYGVVAQSVSMRRGEIGMRLALGASPGAVVRTVLFRAVAMTLVGVVAGAVALVLLGGILRSLLFGVTAGDLGTAGGVALLLVMVAGAAAYLPARRAASVDPVEALRSA